MATQSDGSVKCDFCPSPAVYDSPTIFGGQWAHTCDSCFFLYVRLAPESKLVTKLNRS